MFNTTGPPYKCLLSPINYSEICRWFWLILICFASRSKIVKRTSHKRLSEVYQLCLNALMRYNTGMTGLSWYSDPPFTHENMLGSCPHIVLWGVVDHLLILLQMHFSFLFYAILSQYLNITISYTCILFRQSTGNVVGLCIAFGLFFVIIFVCHVWNKGVNIVC